MTANNLGGTYTMTDVVNLRVGGGADGHSVVPGSLAEPFGALAEMRKLTLELPADALADLDRIAA
ncbi:hypothetical protein GCM10010435_87150 [Winogradskya consettensis]|uniref:Uncharacterized protein n=1 Tax=Winogradskya consettensis TaxID=113560 RepID=A0A919T0R8_9ACTN|nr:hypothetical protein [Actinoplanes consettensis]GIM80871.1 hypothetical protein Aco04nite_73280 [Actinoplanes consettensis]